MKRPAVAAGFVFVALQLVSTALAGSPPNGHEGLAAITAHYRAHHSNLVLSDYLFAVSALPFLVFAAGLRDDAARLSPAAGRVLRAAGTTGAVLMIIDGAIEAVLTGTATYHGEPALVATLFNLSTTIFGFTFIPLCLLVVLAPKSRLGRPLADRTLSWARIAIAGVLAIAPAYVFTQSKAMTNLVGAAYLLFLVWALAAAVELWSREHVAARELRPAIGGPELAGREAGV